MLCYAMLCYAMLCYAMPCHAMPCHTIPYHTIPYHTIPYHTIPYHTIPYHTIPYYTILYYTILYYTIQCYAMLCYAVLCYAMLCYVLMLYFNMNLSLGFHLLVQSTSIHTSIYLFICHQFNDSSVDPSINRISVPHTAYILNSLSLEPVPPLRGGFHSWWWAPRIGMVSLLNFASFPGPSLLRSFFYLDRTCF